MTSLEPWKGQRIGNLRERITFLGDAVQTGTDGAGHPIYGPPVEIEVAARAEPIKGQELQAAGTVGAYHEIVFHVRNMPDIKATWKIEWRGRTYNVTGWRNLDERRRFLSVEARAAT